MPDTSLGGGTLDVAISLVPEDLTEQISQATLRRSVSSCYYAVFHSLAKACADALVGTDPEVRSNRAWVEVYRGLDHGRCYESCQASLNVPFPDGIKDFALDFMQLQVARHRVDYDPLARVDVMQALAFIEVARGCRAILDAIDPKDMVAFSTWLVITSKGAADARTLMKNKTARAVRAAAREELRKLPKKPRRKPRVRKKKA